MQRAARIDERAPSDLATSLARASLSRVTCRERDARGCRSPTRDAELDDLTEWQTSVGQRSA
jgi:hypothetical protein